jgi:hypothetical protein
MRFTRCASLLRAQCRDHLPRALGCGVAIGGGHRGTAGGVSGCLSCVDLRGKGRWRSPHRGRRLPVGCWQTRRVGPRPTVVVLGEAISWTRWSGHRRHNRRVGDQAVFAVVTGPLRVSPTGQDISVDPLATHLIKNRRFPHGRHRRDASAGAASTWCVHTVDEHGDKQPEKPNRLPQLWRLLARVNSNGASPNVSQTWARIGRRHPPTAIEHRTQPDTTRSTSDRRIPGQRPISGGYAVAPPAGFEPALPLRRPVQP